MSQEKQKKEDRNFQSSTLGPEHLQPIIHLQDVTKIYGSGETTIRAVDSVNLSVPTGELVLILGPSGAGKTTLLSLVGGLLQPAEGVVRVAGSDLGQLSSSALADFRLHQIGFVFQFFQLFSALTARENVEMPLRLAGHVASEARQQAEAVLDRFGMSRRALHLPQDLSGGEKQRVALARALALRPPVIIADEPTGSLDSRNGEEVIRLLRQVVDDEQRTVLVASHDRRVAQVATRILHCEDGHLDQLSNTAKELLLS